MTDYTLKFSNAETATAVLEPLAQSHTIDVIGLIFKNTGGTGDDVLMTAIPGWHVNVRGPETSILDGYKVDVATPVRVWL